MSDHQAPHHFVKHARKGACGSSIVETAAGLVVFLPLLILLVFVAVEAAKAVAITQALQQGAREAARDLAGAFANDSNLPNSRTDQNTYAFNLVHINGVINNAAQFSTPSWTNVAGAPGNSATVSDPALPRTVTVTVTYTGGQYGLPNFPDIDPLKLASHINLTGTSTYTIQ